MSAVTEGVLWASQFEGWDAHLAAGWKSTGHLLAQTIMGLLIFSPVLEKMRSFIVSPGLRRFDKLLAALREDRASYSDLNDREDEQYEICLKRIETFKNELDERSDCMVSNNYGLCLFGVLLDIACMTCSWDYLFGPCCIFLAWPLMWLYGSLRWKVGEAVKRAKELIAALELLKTAHNASNSQKNSMATSDLMRLLQK